MFVNVVEFPRVAEGRDAEFRAWFEWSNGIYAGFDGFRSRRLLEDVHVRGRYAAVVEHESEATFMTMHLSDARQEVWERVEPLLTGSPAPHFYDVVSASERHASPSTV